MRAGVRVGLDVGEIRVGVAASDPDGRLASPVATLRRDRSGADLTEIAALARDRGAVEVIVGLPRSLSGREGPAAASARAYAVALAGRVAPVPVRLIDERFTTVVADRALRRVMRGGMRRRRTVLDQAAAVAILQAALDTERASGAPPGEEVR